MKTFRRWAAPILCATACGTAPFAAAEIPVGGSDGRANASREAASSDEKRSEEKRWTSPRISAEGPTLDAAWFAEKRVVVYLVPDGGLPTVRGPAAAVFEDRWEAGDWSVKHVFVTDVPGRFKFIAGRRVGLVDIATAVTKAAGQGDEFVSENEKFLSDHVFFVHDPEGTAWPELLGAAGEGKHKATMVLLENGRVVRSIELPDSSGDSDAGVAARSAVESEVKAEVRRLAERG